MIKIISTIILACLLSEINAQWEPEIRLTSDSLQSTTSYSDRSIAISGNNIHASFTKYLPAKRETFYKRSSDEGTTWTADTCLTCTYGASWDPSIAADDQHIGIVWQDNRDTNFGEIYFKGSFDGGMNWGEEKRISHGDYWATNVTVAIEDSMVFVAWEDYRYSDSESEIFFSRSIDWGETWSEETNVSNFAQYSGVPSLAASGPFLYLFWEDYRDFHGEVYYLRSVNAGESWDPLVKFTNGTRDSWDPCVVASGSAVHLVYMPNAHSFGQNYEIFYQRSLDYGLTWDDTTRLSFDFANSKYPCIAVHGNSLHVTWQDYRDGEPEIYYQRSDDSGETWLEQEERLTDCSGYSTLTSVMVTDSAVHVTWTDDRDGKAQVYYKRYINGSLVDISEKEKPINEYLSVYPNPAGQQVIVGNKQLAVGSQIFDFTLQISELTGRVVKNEGNITSLPYQIDISSLPDGIYIIKIISEAGSIQTQKFIKSN